MAHKTSRRLRSRRVGWDFARQGEQGLTLLHLAACSQQTAGAVNACVSARPAAAAVWHGAAGHNGYTPRQYRQLPRHVKQVPLLPAAVRLHHALALGVNHKKFILLVKADTASWWRLCADGVTRIVIA